MQLYNIYNKLKHISTLTDDSDILSKDNETITNIINGLEVNTHDVYSASVNKELQLSKSINLKSKLVQSNNIYPGLIDTSINLAVKPDQLCILNNTTVNADVVYSYIGKIYKYIIITLDSIINYDLVKNGSVYNLSFYKFDTSLKLISNKKNVKISNYFELIKSLKIESSSIVGPNVQKEIVTKNGSVIYYYDRSNNIGNKIDINSTRITNNKDMSTYLNGPLITADYKNNTNIIERDIIPQTTDIVNQIYENDILYAIVGNLGYKTINTYKFTGSTFAIYEPTSNIKAMYSNISANNMYIITYSGSNIQIIDIDNGNKSSNISITGNVDAVSYSKNNEIIISNMNTIYVISNYNGDFEITKTIDFTDIITNLSESKVYNTVYVTTLDSNDIENVYILNLDDYIISTNGLINHSNIHVMDSDIIGYDLIVSNGGAKYGMQLIYISYINKSGETVTVDEKHADVISTSTQLSNQIIKLSNSKILCGSSIIDVHSKIKVELSRIGKFASKLQLSSNICVGINDEFNIGIFQESNQLIYKKMSYLEYCYDDTFDTHPDFSKYISELTTNKKSRVIDFLYYRLDNGQSGYHVLISDSSYYSLYLYHIIKQDDGGYKQDTDSYISSISNNRQSPCKLYGAYPTPNSYIITCNAIYNGTMSGGIKYSKTLFNQINCEAFIKAPRNLNSYSGWEEYGRDNTLYELAETVKFQFNTIEDNYPDVNILFYDKSKKIFKSVGLNKYTNSDGKSVASWQTFKDTKFDSVYSIGQLGQLGGCYINNSNICTSIYNGNVETAYNYKGAYPTISYIVAGAGLNPKNQDSTISWYIAISKSKLHIVNNLTGTYTPDNFKSKIIKSFPIQTKPNAKVIYVRYVGTYVNGKRTRMSVLNESHLYFDDGKCVSIITPKGSIDDITIYTTRNTVPTFTQDQYTNPYMVDIVGDTIGYYSGHIKDYSEIENTVYMVGSEDIATSDFQSLETKSIRSYFNNISNISDINNFIVLKDIVLVSTANTLYEYYRDEVGSISYKNTISSNINIGNIIKSEDYNLSILLCDNAAKLYKNSTLTDITTNMYTVNNSIIDIFRDTIVIAEDTTIKLLDSNLHVIREYSLNYVVTSISIFDDLIFYSDNRGRAYRINIITGDIDEIGQIPNIKGIVAGVCGISGCIYYSDNQIYMFDGNKVNKPLMRIFDECVDNGYIGVKRMGYNLILVGFGNYKNILKIPSVL